MSEKINKALSEWFQKMGKRGGKARAGALTAKERREIAEKAAKSRWKKQREQQK